MKTKRSIFTVASLILVALVVSACFVACNKQNSDQVERDNQTHRVEEVFLSGVNDKWSADLSDDDVVKLDDAGDYIVSKGWTSLVCDVVKNSSLQTAKIKALADNLASDDGKKLLKEFSANAELLVPMLKQIGLTSNDVSALAYDLISRLIDDGRNTVSDILDRLDSVKDAMMAQGASAVAIENVSQSRLVLNLAKQALVFDETQKAQMQSALSDAKNAMSELVIFAYDTSVNTLTDELYSKLFEEDGALSNVSESELSTLVNALLGNVSRLKNALGQDDIAKLNTALDLFITNFDNKNISSSVYSQIVKYAKYAYMAVDVIPSVCDVALASESVISSKSFIEDFLKYAKFEEEQQLVSSSASTSSLNKLIIAARVIDGVMKSGKFDKNGIDALIDRVCAQGIDGYQKAMPVIILDLLLNVSDIVTNVESDNLKPSHPDIIDNDTLTIMFGSLFFNANVDKLKQNYYAFEMNPTQKNLSALYTSASLCGVEGILGESNPNTKPANPTDETMPYIRAWYNWYINKIDDVSAKIASCVPNVQNDLKAFVADYFAENSTSKAAIEQIANWQIFTECVADDDVQNVYMPVLLASKILGAAILFVW